MVDTKKEYRNTIEKIEELCDVLFSMGIKKIKFDEELTCTSIYCLSNQYMLKKDMRCKRMLRDMLLNRSVSLEAKVHIYNQLQAMEFRNADEQRIDLKKAYKVIVNEAIEQSNVSQLPPVAKEEMNSGVVVCITTQFLGFLHSPTRLLLKLIKTIDDYFEDIKEVYIFNSNEMPTGEVKYQFANGFVANYFEYNQSQLETLLQEAGIQRCGIGYEVNDANEISIEKMNRLAKEIYELKPRHIFAIGGECLLAEICNQFTDVATISLANDLPNTYTKYLIKGGKSNQVEKHKLNNKQYMIEYPFAFDVFIDTEKIQYTRQESELKDDQFLISVVGNRLGEEITDEYIELCIRLMRKYENVGVVIIGEYEESNIIKKVEEELRSRFYCMGYVKDLVGAIGITNVYLNPKRLGGGFSSIAAMQAGVPVISIDYGDVAVYIDSEFKFEDYEGVHRKLEEMIENKDKYVRACKKTSEWFNKYNKPGFKSLLEYFRENS